MSLLAPLSTLSPHITIGFSTATCSVCRDGFGKPLSINKASVRKHVESTAHMANARGLKSLQARQTTQPPKSTRPKVQVDTTVDALTLDFEDTPSLMPEPNTPSSSLEDLWSAFEFLTAPDDVPANTGGSPIVDDLFEDCVAHGPPTPHQHDDNENLEDDDYLSASDSEEEGAEFFRFARTQYQTKSQTSDSWSPYESLAMFLADLMDSSRRLNFSREQMRIILEYARATGGQNIPTYSALRKTQEKLKSQVGDPTHRYVAPSSTVFHLNKISETLKQDMANPQVRPHMNFLPHVEGKHMSQAWHGYKMVHDVKDSVLTPFLRVGARIYYVNELVRRKDDYFIPLRWISYGRSKRLYAIGYRVIETSSGLVVQSDERVTVKVSTFLENFPDMQQREAVPTFSDTSKAFRAEMPHPLRAVAGSRPVYSIPLIVFMDDASGNVSKQWNKHWSCYLSNAALPREVLQAEYNVSSIE